VLKLVGIFDDVSRIDPDFQLVRKLEFIKEIEAVEEKVANIAPTADALRLKVKEFVDGHRVFNWFPETRANPKLLGPILERTAEFILDKLDQNERPNDQEIIDFIKDILNEIN
jgi:hypothetical protein